MRLFVAVDLEPHGPDRPAPRHLTLRFLGEVPEPVAARIPGLLAPIGPELEPFEIVLEGVGAFPSADRPRVVWTGVTVGGAELERLAARVREALRPEFGPAEERFVPHLTLFRVRSPSDRTAALELLGGRRPAPPSIRTRIDRFVLKESQLGARGAVHRTVAEFPLGSAGRKND